jgi:hypothetical protein
MRPEPLLIVLLAGCLPDGGQGTDTGNALRADLVVGGEGLAISQARDVQAVTYARMHIDTIELKPCVATELDELEYPGPFVVDLRDPQPLPEITLAYDTVCELELHVEPNPAEGDPIDGLSLYLEGRTNTGAPFTLASEQAWEYEIEEEIPLQDTLNRFRVLFDVDRWFAGIDPDDGVLTGDTVVIDGDSNPDLLAAFEANVADSPRVELDD